MATTVEAFNRTLASARSTVAFRETINLALDSFCASKTRFLLTMLGMVIGSASIILVATLGLTGRQYALNMIASIGPNMIEMQYVGGSVAGPDNTTVQDSMTIDDLNAVLEQVPGIVASSPMLEYHDRIAMGNGLTKDTMFLGVSPQYKEVRNLKVLAGRFFDDQDAMTHAKVAVLIGPLAEALYGSYGAAIDQKISVKGIPFTVIGVFKEGVETFGQSEVNDQTILIPYPVARYFTGTNTVKQIFFSVANPQQVEPAAAHILEVIRSRHRSTSVYNAFTLTAVLRVMGQIATMLTIVLTLASAITLIVSGVGIMNSMLANVQRAHQGDRHPQGAGSDAARDTNAVPDGIGLHVAQRRTGGHAHRSGASAQPAHVLQYQNPGFRLERGDCAGDLGARRRGLRDPAGAARGAAGSCGDAEVRIRISLQTIDCKD